MKIQIPNVTLLAVSTIRIQDTINALKRSCEEIEFGSVKLVTNKEPEWLDSFIEFEQCTDINSMDDYSLYAFKHLTNHVNTSHCLLIQYDSWVINPHLWDEKWLEYDYIGAPWALKEDAYICHDLNEHVRVGNGGFSLRSKKLLDIPKNHNLPLLQEQGYYNEDGNICVYHRKKMLELGIKYAPLEVACEFSYETPIQENMAIKNPFGFHKRYPV